ncbi:MAG: hypothetical protein M3R13_09295 [Armatimonadota bacterium]|nr:hypothetical protein [Armatimonadota bacterium]
MKNPLVLVGLFAAAAVAWCAVVVYSVAPKMAVERRITNYDLSDDPRTGTTVEIPAADVFGRPIDGPEGRVLLIVSGTCTSCQAKAVGDSPLLEQVDFPIVVVYPDTPDTLRKQFAEGLPARLFVVSDPSERFSKQLNSLWSPRLYIIDGNRLTQLQAEPGEKIWQGSIR